MSALFAIPWLEMHHEAFETGAGETAGLIEGQKAAGGSGPRVSQCRCWAAGSPDAAGQICFCTPRRRSIRPVRETRLAESEGFRAASAERRRRWLGADAAEWVELGRAAAMGGAEASSRPGSGGSCGTGSGRRGAPTLGPVGGRRPGGLERTASEPAKSWRRGWRWTSAVHDERVVIRPSGLSREIWTCIDSSASVQLITR